MFVGENRVRCEAVEKGLQHAPPAGNHGGVLLCLCLLDGIVADGVLGGDGRDDEGGVEPDERVAERLEFRVAVACLGVSGGYVVGDVRRGGVGGGLLSVDDDDLGVVVCMQESVATAAKVSLCELGKFVGAVRRERARCWRRRRR